MTSKKIFYTLYRKLWQTDQPMDRPIMLGTEALDPELKNLHLKLPGMKFWLLEGGSILVKCIEVEDAAEGHTHFFHYFFLFFLNVKRKPFESLHSFRGVLYWDGGDQNTSVEGHSGGWKGGRGLPDLYLKEVLVLGLIGFKFRDIQRGVYMPHNKWNQYPWNSAS